MVKDYNNCCIELKVSGEKITESLKGHVKQCVNYSIKSRKPVVLIYLIFEKNEASLLVKYHQSQDFS